MGRVVKTSGGVNAVTNSEHPQLPLCKENSAAGANLPGIKDFSEQQLAAQKIAQAEINNKSWYQRIADPLYRVMHQSPEIVRQQVGIIYGGYRELVIGMFQSLKEGNGIKESWQKAVLRSGEYINSYREQCEQEKSINGIGSVLGNNEQFSQGNAVSDLINLHPITAYANPIMEVADAAYDEAMLGTTNVLTKALGGEESLTYLELKKLQTTDVSFQVSKATFDGLKIAGALAINPQLAATQGVLGKLKVASKALKSNVLFSGTIATGQEFKTISLPSTESVSGKNEFNFFGSIANVVKNTFSNTANSMGMAGVTNVFGKGYLGIINLKLPKAAPFVGSNVALSNQLKQQQALMKFQLANSLYQTVDDLSDFLDSAKDSALNMDWNNPLNVLGHLLVMGASTKDLMGNGPNDQQNLEFQNYINNESKTVKEERAIAHLIDTKQIKFVSEFELRRKSIELGIDPNNSSTFRGLLDKGDKEKNEKPVIYIDKNLPPELQRAAISHELRHLMAQVRSPRQDQRKEEVGRLVEIRAHYQEEMKLREQGLERIFHFNHEEMKLVKHGLRKVVYSGLNYVVVELTPKEKLEIAASPSPQLNYHSKRELLANITKHVDENYGPKDYSARAAAAATIDPLSPRMIEARAFFNDLSADLFSNRNNTYVNRLLELMQRGISINESEREKISKYILGLRFPEQCKALFMARKLGLTTKDPNTIKERMRTTANLGYWQIYGELIIGVIEEGIIDSDTINEGLQKLAEHKRWNIYKDCFIKAMEAGKLDSETVRNRLEKLRYIDPQTYYIDCLILAMETEKIAKDPFLILQQLSLLEFTTGSYSQSNIFLIKAMKAGIIKKDANKLEMQLRKISAPAHSNYCGILIQAMKAEIIPNDPGIVNEWLKQYARQHLWSNYASCLVDGMEGIIDADTVRKGLLKLAEAQRWDELNECLIKVLEKKILTDKELILNYLKLLRKNNKLTFDLVVSFFDQQGYAEEINLVQQPNSADSDISTFYLATTKTLEHELGVQKAEIVVWQEKSRELVRELEEVNEQAEKYQQIDLQIFQKCILQALPKMRFLSENVTSELINRYLTDRKNPKILQDAMSLFAFLSSEKLKLLKDFYIANPTLEQSKKGFSSVDYIQSLVGYCKAYQVLGIGNEQFKADLNEKRDDVQNCLFALAKRCLTKLADDIDISINEETLFLEGRDILAEWDTRYLGLLAATQSLWPENHKNFFKVLLKSAIEGTSDGLLYPPSYKNYPITETYGKENFEIVQRIRRHNLQLLKCLEEKGLNIEVILHPERYFTIKNITAQVGGVKPADLLRKFKSRLDSFLPWLNENQSICKEEARQIRAFLQRDQAWANIDQAVPNGNLLSKSERRDALNSLRSQLIRIEELMVGHVPEQVADLTIVIDEIAKYDPNQKSKIGSAFTRFWRRQVGRDAFAGNCAGSCTALESNASAVFEFILDLGTIYQFVGNTEDDIGGYRRFFVALNDQDEPALYIDTTDGTLAYACENVLDEEIKEFARKLGIKENNIKPRSEKIKTKLGDALTEDYFQHSAIEIRESEANEDIDFWEPQGGWDWEMYADMDPVNKIIQDPTYFGERVFAARDIAQSYNDSQRTQAAKLFDQIVCATKLPLQGGPHLLGSCISDIQKNIDRLEAELEVSYPKEFPMFQKTIDALREEGLSLNSEFRLFTDTIDKLETIVSTKIVGLAFLEEIKSAYLEYLQELKKYFEKIEGLIQQLETNPILVGDSNLTEISAALRGNSEYKSVISFLFELLDGSYKEKITSIRELIQSIRENDILFNFEKEYAITSDANRKALPYSIALEIPADINNIPDYQLQGSKTVLFEIVRIITLNAGFGMIEKKITKEDQILSVEKENRRISIGISPTESGQALSLKFSNPGIILDADELLAFDPLTGEQVLASINPQRAYKSRRIFYPTIQYLVDSLGGSLRIYIKDASAENLGQTKTRVEIEVILPVI